MNPLQNGELNGMLRLVVGGPVGYAAQPGRERASSGRPGIKRMVQPRSINQRRYVEAIEQNDMVFGIGPAGTGKTYLAVAMAAAALLAKKDQPDRAGAAGGGGRRAAGISAGELQEKVDPYLRPLYDALYDLLEPERVDKMLERNVIEVAPLAFMRGRTLNDAFIIMDEAQNTTSEQMKMFLTRLGNNAKAVITGDMTQIDLPNPKKSGLVEAMNILDGVDGISFVRFEDGRRGAAPLGAADHCRLRQLRQGAAGIAAEYDRAKDGRAAGRATELQAAVTRRTNGPSNR